MPGVDVATLGIRVDATEIEDAKQALDALATAGTRSENAISKLTVTAQQLAFVERTYGKSVADRIRAEHGLTEAQEARATSTDNVATATERVTTVTRGGTLGVGRLNTALLMLARQATGTSPAVAQLANVVGAFALRASTMTAVLLGLAALALAWRKIADEAKAAEDATKRANAALLELVANERARESGRDPVLAGNISTNIERVRQAERDNLDLERRRNELRDAPGTGGLSSEARAARLAALQDETDANDRLITSLNTLISASQEIQAASIMEADFTRATAAIEQAVEAVKELDAANREMMAGLTLGGAVIAGEPTGIIAELTAPSEERRRLRWAPREEQQFFEEQLRLLREAEEDLARARLRANEALTRSLENVGRAYGGVIDQIFALTAATLRLSTMPGFGDQLGTGVEGAVTFGDRARGFGTAALTGIGIGASTGSPALGALGGAAAGLALTGGNPIGAIVGAVSGLVSGLIESGRKAREAQQIWESNFRAFEQMFDEPLTRLEQNDKRFEELTGGKTAEQIREQLARAKWVVGSGLGLGRDPRGLRKAALEEWIDENERLLETYDKNVEKAKALARAEEDLHDARFRALNSPSGLNLALFGFNATRDPNQHDRHRIDFSAIGVPDGGGGGDGGDGGITVNGDLNITLDGGDPDEIVTMVRKAITREAFRGGPTTFTTR